MSEHREITLNRSKHLLFFHLSLSLSLLEGGGGGVIERNFKSMVSFIFEIPSYVESGKRNCCMYTVLRQCFVVFCFELPLFMLSDGREWN